MFSKKILWLSLLSIIVTYGLSSAMTLSSQQQRIALIIALVLGAGVYFLYKSGYTSEEKIVEKLIEKQGVELEKAHYLQAEHTHSAVIPYLDRIKKEMPTFSYTTYEQFHDGRNHDSVAFDKNTVFRFVKNDGSVKREHDLLEYLHGKISCRLPQALYVSQDGSWNQESFMTGKKMRVISQEQAWEMLPHIVQFLKELHNIPIDAVKQLGYIHDTDHSGYVRHMKEQTKTYLAEIIDESLLQKIYVFIEEAFSYVHPTPCLIHSDVNGKNIYWDDKQPDNKKLGVIDFDDAELFDPAKDFCHFGRYGIDYLQKMIRLYGSTDPGFFDRTTMYHRRARLHVCINHIQLQRKRTPQEVAVELEHLFG